MKNKFKILTLLFTFFILSGCNYLDEKPYDWAQPADIFTAEGTYLQPVNQTYAYMFGGFNRVSDSFLDAATDDGISTTSSSTINLLARGFATSNNTIESCWEQSYAGIRQALYVQKNLKEQTLFLNQKTKTEVAQIQSVYAGEMFALRALFEFNLMRHYGGYAIISQCYALGDPAVDLIKRSSFEACVKNIVTLCDSAMKYLSVEPIGGSYGRMNSGMALAIKAKTLIYSASPLYNQPGNTNPLTGNIGASDANTKTRWELAAAACAAVINLKTTTGTNKYSLYTNYEKLFITCPNDEYIVFNTALKSNTLENRQYPPTISKNSGGGTVPVQEFVDAFSMADGSNYERSSASTQYNSRDPRLTVSVGFNGSTYGTRGKIYSKTGSGATMDALNSVVDKSTNTSYYLRKFLDFNVNFAIASPVTTFHLFPIIRLADILLLYSEAMTNAFGPDVDPMGYGMTATSALLKVRLRAGFTSSDKYLTGITTKEQMMAKIKNERRIELCFEEQRYFDLRRWMDGDKLNQPVSGIRIEDNAGTLNYTYFVVDGQRRFDTKMYLHPIPLSVINKSPGLEQNPGW